VTVEDTTLAATNNLQLLPSANTVAANAKLPYKINLVSANGSVQDITPVITAGRSVSIASIDTDPAFAGVSLGLATAGAAGPGTITTAGASGAGFVPAAGVAINVSGSPANITVTP
jgi:hypothetical protein